MRPNAYLVRVLEQGVTDSMNCLAHLERELALTPDRAELHQLREQVQSKLMLQRRQVREARDGVIVHPDQCQAVLA